MSDTKMRIVTYSDFKEKKIEFVHESRVQVPVEVIMAFLLEHWDEIPRKKRDIFEAKLLEMRLGNGKSDKLVEDTDEEFWF